MALSFHPSSKTHQGAPPVGATAPLRLWPPPDTSASPVPSDMGAGRCPKPAPGPRQATAALVALVVVLAVGLGTVITLTSRSLQPPDDAALAAQVAPSVVDVTSTLVDDLGTVSGTGIVLRSSGLVVTNNHVIEWGASIMVRDVGNGRSYRATVLGTDVTGDLAVLQLHGARRLATAPAASSSGLRPGQPVVAIGNADGVDGRPSSAGGTIVALHRSMEAFDAVNGSMERLSGLIETNTALQAGDSGGPLVDTSGRVIGINTAASSGQSLPKGSNQAFAIPINTALATVRQVELGRGTRAIRVGPTAFLGVVMTSAASVPTAPTPEGAYVIEVTPGSPAAAAGLSPGDVIVAAGGQRISTPSDLTEVLDHQRPGDRIEISWAGPFGASGQAVVELASGPPQ